MRAIIDRDKSGGSGSAPYLFQNYYSDVPFGSAAWAIVRVPDFAVPVSTPGRPSLNFLKNSTTIFSVRYTGSVHLRREIEESVVVRSRCSLGDMIFCVLPSAMPTAYKTAVVSYVDILGFRDVIETSEDLKETVNRFANYWLPLIMNVERAFPPWGFETS